MKIYEITKKFCDICAEIEEQKETEAVGICLRCHRDICNTHKRDVTVNNFNFRFCPKCMKQIEEFFENFVNRKIEVPYAITIWTKETPRPEGAIEGSHFYYKFSE